MDVMARLPGTSASALRRKHLAFKAHAAAVLLREAEVRGPCSTFEECMVKAGLDAIRPRHDPDGFYRKRVKVVGETTAEAFEKWKRRTERYLMMVGADHGYTQESHLAVLREAGFRTEKPQLRTIKVAVTLEVPTRLRLYPDDGEPEIREQLSDEQVRRLLYERYQNNRRPINWEVVRVDDPRRGEGDAEVAG